MLFPQIKKKNHLSVSPSFSLILYELHLSPSVRAAASIVGCRTFGEVDRTPREVLERVVQRCGIDNFKKMENSCCLIYLSGHYPGRRKGRRSRWASVKGERRRRRAGARWIRPSGSWFGFGFNAGSFM